ncbi:MAG: 4Fe-4S dicluster domain-containing protein [Deltaproteobacteria bacterium]|nr:4Fe-4S dicluster domain-containing protein [Deltaproteobacteria bacterium]MCF8118658.1 4Fe-4S dicluster domain-containing protein [Deltaproteobacteria bacterium]
MPMTFLIDTSRCTACRGCQVACKEWNDLQANKTRQRGTHQNPPDLNPFNYKLVRFAEYKENGKVVWYFFPDQCRHCVSPPCKEAADSYVEGAIIKDPKTGAVIFTERTRLLKPEQVEEVISYCPYNIPRLDTGTGILAKCTMCNDRVKRNMLPMCVKTCPTGTMNFGERSKMVALAKKRLAELKKDYPNAQLQDPDDVNTIFLLTEDPKKYFQKVG